MALKDTIEKIKTLYTSGELEAKIRQKVKQADEVVEQAAEAITETLEDFGDELEAAAHDVEAKFKEYCPTGFKKQAEHTKVVKRHINAGEYLHVSDTDLVIRGDVNEGASIRIFGKGNLIIEGDVGKDAEIVTEKGSIQVQDVAKGANISANDDLIFREAGTEVVLRSRNGNVHGRSTYSDSTIEAQRDVTMERIGAYNNVTAHSGSIFTDAIWKGSELSAKRDIKGTNKVDPINVNDDVTLTSRRGEILVDEDKKGKNVQVTVELQPKNWRERVTENTTSQETQIG
ncbi:MAG: hypothetical protein ACPG80_04585 [Rickettsiales bacterium]